MKEKTIAVDLDGVIFEYDEWKGIKHFGPVIPGVKDALAKFMEMGFNVIIYTTRTNTKVNKGFQEKELIYTVWCALVKNGIPFDDISTEKPIAEFYIDDRAIRFKSWTKTIKKVKGLIKT